MPAIGVPELIIIFLIVLVLFGASRLPKLAKSIAESKKELQKGLKGGDIDKDDEKKV